MKSHHANCAVCKKPGRTGFGFEELLNPAFKLEETMSQISGFQRKDGTWPYGKVTRFVHLRTCHQVFEANKSKYRRKRP